MRPVRTARKWRPAARTTGQRKSVHSCAMFGIDRFLLFVALPIVVAASLLEAALLSRRGGNG